jgi:RHS repeat-associated protein
MVGNWISLRAAPMHKDISTMRSVTRFLILLCLLVVGQAALAQSGGTVTYIYTDPQGTPLAETDANGNVTATFDYTPYGSTALGTPPNGPGYTGHVNDPETNLVYMQARYYDVATGQFLSRDPDRQKSGINDYAYVGDNPINRTDPTGRFQCSNKVSCETGTEISNGLKQAQANYKPGSANYKQLGAEISFLGAAHDGNNVTVTAQTHTNDTAIGRGAGDKKSQTATLTINVNNVHIDGNTAAQDFVNLIATGSHEIKHAMDDLVSGTPTDYKGELNHEVRGVRAETPVWQAFHTDDPWGTWTVKGGLNMNQVRAEAKASADSWCPNKVCP